MRERGCRVYKTEFGVCGHRAWTPAMLQGDVFGWLISRAKNGDRFFAAEPSPTSPEKIGIFADVTEGDLKQQPTKAVRRGPAVPAHRPGQLAAPTARFQADWSAEPIDGPRSPFSGEPAVATVEPFRLELIDRYFAADEIKEALTVADKVKNRQELVRFLLRMDARRFNGKCLTMSIES